MKKDNFDIIKKIIIIYTLLINFVFSATSVIFELNVIPIDKDEFKAGENNHIRIALWNKSRNYPVSLEEIEPLNNNMFEIIIASKDIRSFNQFHYEDFPHFNNETTIPPNSSYFDIEYVFPLAGEYVISVKCKTNKKVVRINKAVTVEGDEKMNIDTLAKPSDPEVQKIIYYHPIPLDNINSIYSLPIIPHSQLISKNDLESELKMATNPIYGTKFTSKNMLKAGYCNNVVLEFFLVELDEQGEIKETPINTLFQYNDIPIRAILSNAEGTDIEMVQGNILNNISDKFPNCGGKISAPTGMVYGPNFGFSIPYRKNGLYQVIFQISHSLNGNTYLLVPSLTVFVKKEGESIEYASQDYVDTDSSYNKFIENVINKQTSAPGSDKIDNNDDNNNDDSSKNKSKIQENKSTTKSEETSTTTTEQETTTTTEEETTTTTEQETTTTTTEEETTTTKEQETTTTTAEQETKTDTASPTSTEVSEEKISNATHGKIIFVGIAGIIVLSGMMFYKQKKVETVVENIPLEYNEIVSDEEGDEYDGNTSEKLIKEIEDEEMNNSFSQSESNDYTFNNDNSQ